MPRNRLVARLAARLRSAWPDRSPPNLCELYDPERVARQNGLHDPVDPTPREACPCCDYVSLPERGRNLICPVCCWSDSGLEPVDLDVPSPENHGTTLRMARRTFLEFGVCDPAMLPYALSPEERSAYRSAPRAGEHTPA